MERKYAVLDIGIGKGGRYIDNDSPSVIRVGFDKNRIALRCLKEDFGIEAIVGDAEVSNKTVLPFRDGAFDQVDILFPFNELLYVLVAQDHRLWKELHRVLVDKGKVNVIVDSPTGPSYSTNYHGKEVEVPSPELYIQVQAERADFLTTKKVLSVTEVRSLGTEFALFIAKAMDGIGTLASIYQIIATKQ